MFQILSENILLTIIIITLTTLSILSQIIIGQTYQKLIGETENLSTTDNKHLKLCKLKFQNCYQLNGNVPNIAVFVDKFLNRLILFRITLGGIRRLSSQLMMLAVFVAGVGSCLGIIAGETMFRLLPYYLLAIAGLYIYFSVAVLVDIPGRRETLKINLVDYLENHMLYRLKNGLPEVDYVAEKSDTPSKAAVRSADLISPPAEQSPLVISASHNINLASEKQAVPDVVAQFSDDEIEELLQELIV